jgi:hypothetical protein
LRVGSDPENNRFTIRYADKEAVLEALAISIGSASL